MSLLLPQPFSIISPKTDQNPEITHSDTLFETVRQRAIRKLMSVRSIQKEKEMNKIFKTLSLIVILALAVIAIGAQVVQALRDAAAPPALPYGLTAQDTMASVEQKLGQPKVTYAPQAGWEAGLPDEGSSPDHVRYWAIYKRFGLTVVYNTPSASDKSATVHAIYLHE
jgi:hypothetical protein